MARSPMHEKQKFKNYAVLIALIVFMVTVFFVSLIRMKGG